MKFIILAVALVAVAAADVTIQVLKSDAVVNPDSYSYSYELDNGVKASEEGKLKDPDTIAVHGAYEWKSPEGESVSIQYVADENGYQPSGTGIPVAPPVPEYIQRALQWIAAHPAH